MRVDGDDWTRLGTAAERVAQFIGNKAYMRMRDGHCEALELREGAKGTREYFCSIYAERPATCRDLGRGSPQCEGEIALKGDRPRAAT